MRAAGIDEDVFKPMGREDTRRVVSAHADGAQYDVTPRGVKLADAFTKLPERDVNRVRKLERLAFHSLAYIEHNRAVPFVERVPG